MHAQKIDPDILCEAVELRHALHRAPELSGAETGTAARIAGWLAHLAPVRLLTGLGGTGVAAVFGSGPRGLLIRCELDALPIAEWGARPYRSEHPGIAHSCGHDGHMAILWAVAAHLARTPPACRVILLFQPAEETGQGARAVLEDPRFADLRADMAIALHNLPKMPFGAVGLASGAVNCASRGVQIRLHGRSSHAAQPGHGHSPAGALAALIPALAGLSRDRATEDPAFRLATLTHARLGQPTFGIAPGDAEVRVTLRTLRDSGMAELEDEARALIDALAAEFTPEISIHEAFAHCENAPEAVAVLAAASDGLVRDDRLIPMRASEDFGQFGAVMPAAMLFLGAGLDHPELHNPDYDFPDGLIEIGAQIFLRAIQAFCES